MFIKMVLHWVMTIAILLVTWVGITQIFVFFFGAGNFAILISTLGMFAGIFLAMKYLNRFIR